NPGPARDTCLRLAGPGRCEGSWQLLLRVLGSLALRGDGLDRADFPVALVVFLVSQDVPDEDHLILVIDVDDQAELVTTDIEHDEIFDQVGGGMVSADVGELLPLGATGDLEPLAQRPLGIGMFGPELAEPLAGDNMQGQYPVNLSKL